MKEEVQEKNLSEWGKKQRKEDRDRKEKRGDEEEIPRIEDGERKDERKNEQKKREK